jgi:DNA-binding SARP family transcriptional activator/tetratricopeptide (TPR) repeat protein
VRLSPLRFRILGPLEVRGDRDVVRLTARKQRTLLAVLLCNVNEPISTDRVVHELWPESVPASATENLRSYAFQLRRALGDRNRIVRHARGWTLALGPDELDSVQFEQLAERGRELLATDASRAGEMLRAALGLWRGPVFAGLTSPTLEEHARRLEDLRLTVVQLRVDADLRTGRHGDLAAELSTLVTEHPMQERFHAQLMLALYRQGRRADALRVYRDARDTMVAELGLEPGADLRRLHSAILRGEEDAELVRTSTAGGHGDRVTTPVRERPVVPNMLPADIADFAGREDEIELLCQELTTSPPVGGPLCVVAGRGGVGKTALAVHVAHRLRENYRDGLLYVDLHGVAARPAEPAEVLARFLRALGVDGTAIPDGTDERAELYRSALAGREVIVILDNAADGAQVEPLLPGDAGCAVIVTSRTRLTGIPGARMVELRTLRPAQALRLLARVSGPDRIAAEPGPASELVRLCGHLPLAVRIAGARLARRPHWTVARMAARLADENRRLDELVHDHLDMRANLALSYRGLDHQAKRLFALAGLLDAPDFAPWTAAALLDTTADLAADVLDRLVDAQLLAVSNGPGVRYQLHDLVRVYARERAESELTPESRGAALMRAFGCWLHLAEQAHVRHVGGDYLVVHGAAPRWRLDPAQLDDVLADPLAWADVERHGIVTTVRQAADAGAVELCWDLAVTAAPLFEVHRHNDEWHQSHQYALTATRAAGDARGEAAVLTELSELHIGQQHYGEAASLLEIAMSIFDRLGDRHGHAIAVQKAAVLDRLQGRYSSALTRYKQVVPTFADAGDHGSKALALRGIGQVHLERGRQDLALRYLNEALVTARAGHAHRQRAQILYRIGEVYLEQDRLDEAQQALREVLELVSGFEDMPGQAWSLHGLGRVRLAQDRLDEAVSLLNEALAISVRIGERAVQGRVLLALGTACHRQQRFDRAVVHLSEAATVFRDTDTPLWEIRTLRALAAAHQDAGQPDRATEDLRRAAAISAGFGAP